MTTEETFARIRAQQRQAIAQRRKQKPVYKIAQRDPRTGLYYVESADGSITPNGWNLSNAKPRTDRLVRATSSDRGLILDGAKALPKKKSEQVDPLAIDRGLFGYSGYFAGQIFNKEEPAKKRKTYGKIKVLFSVGRQVYLGGDRADPELLFEAPSGRDIGYALIDSHGDGNQYEAGIQHYRPSPPFGTLTNIKDGAVTSELSDGTGLASIAYLASNSLYASDLICWTQGFWNKALIIPATSTGQAVASWNGILYLSNHVVSTTLDGDSFVGTSFVYPPNETRSFSADGANPTLNTTTQPLILNQEKTSILLQVNQPGSLRVDIYDGSTQSPVANSPVTIFNRQRTQLAKHTFIGTTLYEIKVTEPSRSELAALTTDDALLTIRQYDLVGGAFSLVNTFEEKCLSIKNASAQIRSISYHP